MRQQVHMRWHEWKSTNVASEQTSYSNRMRVAAGFPFKSNIRSLDQTERRERGRSMACGKAVRKGNNNKKRNKMKQMVEGNGPKIQELLRWIFPIQNSDGEEEEKERRPCAFRRDRIIFAQVLSLTSTIHSIQTNNQHRPQTHYKSKCFPASCATSFPSITHRIADDIAASSIS